jgi:hypothetical protein
VTVRGECFAKGVTGTAAGRILVTRTTGLTGCRSVSGQCLRRFGSRDRQRSANCQSCDNNSQDFNIHLSSPLMGTIKKLYAIFHAEDLISINIVARITRLFNP